MNKIYSITKTIPSNACNAQGICTLPYLLQVLQELALADSERIGQGFDHLVSTYNTAWMILQNDISVLHPIRAGECLTVQTWYRGCKGLTASRDYLFLAGQEEVLHCTQVWAVVERSTRKLYNPQLIPELQITAPDRILPTVRHATHPTAELKKAAERKVTAQDIDVNGHMNNARYVAHALPYLPEGSIDGAYRLSLSYHSELLEGVTYDCLTGGGEEGFEVAFQVDGKDCFYLQLRS